MIVLGDLMVDVVARVSVPTHPPPNHPLARGSDTRAEVTVCGGGAGANVTAWAAWLGAPVALVCRIGDDERGRMAVDELHAGGVEVHASVDTERATGTCVVLVEAGGERTMLPDPGANDGPYELPGNIEGHLHVSGYALVREGARPSALAAIERARAAGVTVSVDPASWALLRPGVIPAVELLLPNVDEARVLAGAAAGDDLEDVARALVARGAAAEIALKLGSAGALWTDGSDIVHVPAQPADVVDTTGAGDAFAAGVLTARHQGAGPGEALSEGCRVAAIAVARAGARPG
jgi:ribokinase